jgi:hypothetical protein
LQIPFTDALAACRHAHRGPSQVDPAPLPRAIADAIISVDFALPDQAERLHAVLAAIKRTQRLPGPGNTQIRLAAGRMGGLLMTVHGLDARRARPRMLQLLRTIRAMALEIEADLETRIPILPAGANIIPFPASQAMSAA